jgi:hypothetical protein
MRNFAPNSLNFKSGTGLYCVWVCVHEGGKDRLVSKWIDPASTTVKSQLQGIAGGIEQAVSSCEVLATADAGEPDTEHPKLALRG